MRLLTLMAVTAGLMVLGPVAEASAMQILVKTPQNTLLTLEVEAFDPIEVVKAKIQDQTGFAPSRQRLVFGGKLLPDGSVLSDFNVQKDAQLLLTIRRYPPRIWLSKPTKLKGKLVVRFRAYLDSTGVKVRSVVAKVDGRKVWSGKRSSGRLARAGLRPGRHRLTLTVTDSAGLKATKSVRFTTR